MDHDAWLQADAEALAVSGTFTTGDVLPMRVPRVQHAAHAKRRRVESACPTVEVVEFWRCPLLLLHSQVAGSIVVH